MEDSNTNLTSFEEVFSRSWRQVRNFYRRRGLGAESEDLTQDVFLNIFMGWETLRSEPSASWIRVITANVFKNHLRYRHSQKRSAQEISLEDVPELDDLAEPDPPSDDPLQDRERRASLATAMTQLPAQMRLCILLYAIHGFNQREIAQRLGITTGTVRVQLFRGRNRLRKELQASVRSGGGKSNLDPARV